MAESTYTLETKLADAIDAAPHLSRKQLRFENNDGRVVLRGTVASYFQKQMAQEAIRDVDGVEWINNELQVTSM